MADFGHFWIICGLEFTTDCVVSVVLLTTAVCVVISVFGLKRGRCLAINLAMTPSASVDSLSPSICIGVET